VVRHAYCTYIYRYICRYHVQVKGGKIREAKLAPYYPPFLEILRRMHDSACRWCMAWQPHMHNMACRRCMQSYTYGNWVYLGVKSTCTRWISAKHGSKQYKPVCTALKNLSIMLGDQTDLILDLLYC
jgi:hypothetical protein